MTRQPRLYGLLDCNAFFVSCEKLFRPDLNGKPVVVLSNNDGVVVSRSAEAKKLGIPMGEPYYKIKRLAESGQVIVFSSNYRLYGDMSNRVMKTLQQWTPHIEIYSIDEAFLDLTNYSGSIELLMNEIVSTVTKWTGIPVSLGVGATMTLAKVANDLAKKGNGTCALLDPLIREQALGEMEIGEVWGIGRRLAPRLHRLGFRTAKDFAAADPLWVRKHFSIVSGQQTFHLSPAQHRLNSPGKAYHRGVQNAVISSMFPLCKSITVLKSFIEGGIVIAVATSVFDLPIFPTSEQIMITPGNLVAFMFQ